MRRENGLFDWGPDDDRPSLRDESEGPLHPAQRGMVRTGELDAYGNEIWRHRRRPNDIITEEER